MNQKLETAKRYDSFIGNLTRKSNSLEWKVEDVANFSEEDPDKNEQWFQDLGFMPAFGITDETRLPVFFTRLEGIEIIVMADGALLMQGIMVSLGATELYIKLFRKEFEELTTQLKALYAKDPGAGIGRKGV